MKTKASPPKIQSVFIFHFLAGAFTSVIGQPLAIEEVSWMKLAYIYTTLHPTKIRQ